MEEVEIDYKPLYEQVVRELEQARLRIVELKYAPDFQLSLRQVRGFVQDNYVLILVGVMLLSIILSMVSTVRGLLRERGDNGLSE